MPQGMEFGLAALAVAVGSRARQQPAALRQEFGGCLDRLAAEHEGETQALARQDTTVQDPGDGYAATLPMPIPSP